MFDPSDPRLIEDPYPVYAELRAHHPVVRTRFGGVESWVVSRFDDVSALFGSPHARMRPSGDAVPSVYGDGPAARMWRNMISMMDPPAHTRLRRLVSRPFSRSVVDGFEPAIERVVNDALDAVVRRGEMDVVDDFALVVPMRVICELLGVPEDDWDLLASWTPDFLRIFLPEANSPAELELVHQASQNFLDYFGELLDRRTVEPRDDLTSRLAARAEDDDALTRDELIATLRGLLTAGFETTMGTLTSAIWCLARDPVALGRLRSEPALAGRVADEALRWETPVQVQLRYFAEPIEVAGTTIQPGERALLLMGSANHDPDAFPDPERFDIDRDASGHHSFGGGRHRCVGAHLARLELEVALRSFAQRVGDVDVQVDKISRRPNFQFRSIESLPITFRPLEAA